MCHASPWTACHVFLKGRGPYSKGGRRHAGDGRNYGRIHGRHEGSEVGVLQFQMVVLGRGGVRQWTSQDGDLLILGGLGESLIWSIMLAATSLSILVLQDCSHFSSYSETTGRTLLSFGWLKTRVSLWVGCNLRKWAFHHCWKLVAVMEWVWLRQSLACGHLWWATLETHVPLSPSIFMHALKKKNGFSKKSCLDSTFFHLLEFLGPNFHFPIIF